MPKTNACRVLDRLGIAYTLHEYDVDLEDLSAKRVAEKVGLPLEQVWKTLLLQGEGRSGKEHIFAVVAGDAELDLKACARLAGLKTCELVPLEDVQPLTGYVRGGVTALAAKKPFPVVVDELVEVHDVISVSAGVRGTQIFVAPSDYLRATGARTGPISRANVG